MKKNVALISALIILIAVGCKKETEKNKVDVSLAKKYAKWNVRVYKEKELKKVSTYLSKGEPVDLMGTETVKIKGKSAEISRIKLTDDTIGFLNSLNLADRPVVFTENTKVYVRNNISSRVYHEIPRGTIAFIIAEKSKDSQTKHGCVFVDDKHHIISTGYNSFAVGLPDSILANMRDKKYKYILSMLELKSRKDQVQKGQEDILNRLNYMSPIVFTEKPITKCKK